MAFLNLPINPIFLNKIFFMYIKVSKNSSANQENKERPQKKLVKDISFSKEEKEKKAIIRS